MIVLALDPGRSIGHAVLDFESRRPRILLLEVTEDTNPAMSWMHLNASISPIIAIETNETYVTRERNVNPAPFINAARIGGELAGYARALGLRVVAVSAHEWRRAIVGKRNASDADIKAAVSRLVDLPKRSNAHERDAIGVALYAERFVRLGAKPASNTNLPKPWKPASRRVA